MPVFLIFGMSSTFVWKINFSEWIFGFIYTNLDSFPLHIYIYIYSNVFLPFILLLLVYYYQSFIDFNWKGSEWGSQACIKCQQFIPVYIMVQNCNTEIDTSFFLLLTIFLQNIGNTGNCFLFYRGYCVFLSCNECWFNS